MARIPVSGVRTSWANAASAASTMPGPTVFIARVLATRLRALPEARPEARFFDGRFFTDRVVRRERDVAAMIPLTLAVSTMPRPGATSHAEGGFFPCNPPGARLPWIEAASRIRQADQTADIG
jgi:hypothetical protein